MPDGVRLSARLWLPEDQPVPVVLEYIPYRKRDGYRAHDNHWGEVLGVAGIAYARIDVRGTGDSEGILTDEYTNQEIDDGVRCIAWLAAQSWCTGQVGMRGISWGAINTLQIAARQPPALKAILPIAGTENRYTDDAHYHGGLLGRANLQWGVLFKSVLAGPPDPEIVGEAWLEMWQTRLEATPGVVGTWMQHPSFDSYWQRGVDVIRHIRCPVFLVAGWRDTYVNPIPRLLEELNCPARALIGDWGHTYPQLAGAKGLDWPAEELAWWQLWLDENSTTQPAAQPATELSTTPSTKLGGMPAKPVRICIDDVWLDYDPSETQPHTLHLGPGELVREPVAIETEIPRSIVGAATPEWLDRPPLEQSLDDAESACFETAVLPEDLVIVGQPTIDLTFSPSTLSKAGSALYVRVCDVAPDGHSELVSRAVVDLRSTDTQADGLCERITLHLRYCGYRFRCGHRIRLALSGAPWPMVWPPATSPALTVVAGCLALPVLARFPTHNAQPPPRAKPAQPFDTQVGQWSYTAEQALTRNQDEQTGLTISQKSKQDAHIDPANPANCVWQHEMYRCWERADWRCEIDVQARVWSDQQGLHIRERLRAQHNARTLIDLTHEQIVSLGQGTIQEGKK